MALSINTPPKINQQIHPVSSFTPKYADGYDVIPVCSIHEKMTEILCIYENRIYYLVNATTSEYASYYTYDIYYTDVKTNTITNTGLSTTKSKYGSFYMMVDPDRRHIYSVNNSSQVISFDLINATSTIIPGITSFPQNFSLRPGSNLDEYGYLNIGPIFFDTTNDCIYCNKPNNREYRADELHEIPVYQASSNHGDLPTFTQIASIPCGASGSGSYYWNIHVMGISGSVIRYLLYQNCTTSNLSDAERTRLWSYNEYDYINKTYYFDSDKKNGIGISIANTNKKLYLYVTPSRKIVLPIYYSLNSSDYRIGLSTQELVAYPYKYYYDGWRIGYMSYPMGAIFTQPSDITEPFKYEVRDIYDQSTMAWVSAIFENMTGGGIISDQDPNGFYTVYNNQLAYITVVEE